MEYLQSQKGIVMYYNGETTTHDCWDIQVGGGAGICWLQVEINCRVGRDFATIRHQHWGVPFNDIHEPGNEFVKILCFQ